MFIITLSFTASNHSTDHWSLFWTEHLLPHYIEAQIFMKISLRCWRWLDIIYWWLSLSSLAYCLMHDLPSLILFFASLKWSTTDIYFSYDFEPNPATFINIVNGADYTKCLCVLIDCLCFWDPSLYIPLSSISSDNTFSWPISDAAIYSLQCIKRQVITHVCIRCARSLKARLYIL